MDNAISVTQVNNYIKHIFDAEYMLQNIFVYGEIGVYKISNGIAYFNLKDENSLISCVLFNANNFPVFEVGDQVVVRGSVNYYVKGGKLSLNAFSIERFGVGLLYQKFLELKAELESLGYFDQSIKKTLPERVKKIGVVTSETGAVIRDIIDVSTRRNNLVNIVLYPVKVQGLGAEKEIAKGIEFFSDYDGVDVVIVARGGGSLEDLQPYNTKIVADAVFNCKKPLVSAVGHETDYTIIDFVSDLRAPTPSAAAELVVNKKTEDVMFLQDRFSYITSLITHKIVQKLDEVEYVSDNLSNRFEAKFNTKFLTLQKTINCLEKSILEKINKNLICLNDTKSLIAKYDVKTIMSKGYVKAFSNGKLIKRVDQLNVKDEVDLQFEDGLIKTIVKSKEVKNGV